MNRAGLSLALSIALAAPGISYFTNVREVSVSQPALQNYFVVDEEIWSWARPDLGDLRMYDGEAQVQYALSVQRGGTSSQEAGARILNLSNVGGRTEFDLDMGPIAEYDRIRLNLDAKNFVLSASLAGSNTLGERPTSQLPSSTLYDFAREDLGSNSVLKLPTSSFRYLHVRLSPGISPPQVKSATVYDLQETKTIWNPVGSCAAPWQQQRVTVTTCQWPSRVPVDRVRFEVDPKQVNFRRSVTLTDSIRQGTGNGEITRVRLNRAGTAVVSQQMEVPVAIQGPGPMTVSIDNGDNPPLAILGVQLLAVERRVYFDPQGKSSLKLFYGDLKLNSPVYDYARFFNADPAAARSVLGPGTHNHAYEGRADERPWSERHNLVLWLAMLLAVAVLALLAFRGLQARAG